MKKISIFSSIMALMFIFGACSKDLVKQGDEEFLFSGGVKSAVGELNAGFDPNGTYMTYGNQGEGYKGDAITTIQVVTSEVPDWNWKTVYNFYLKNGAGDEFLSFCGNYFSTELGEVGLVEPLDADIAAIIGALNYINNEFGSIDTWSGMYGELTSTEAKDNTKLIAQFAIWLILDPGFDIQINQPGCEGIVAAAKAAVANPATGNIGIYFLAGPDYPNDIEGLQPQIVPVVKPTTPKGGIDILKTVDGIAINAKFTEANLKNLIYFELYKDGVKVDGPVYVNGEGRIVFADLEPGNYVIREIITDAGIPYFYPHSDVNVTIGNSIYYGSADFDLTAPYSVDFNVNKSVTVFKDGDPQAVYEFIATNVNTGATYNSFCAFNNSHGFPPYYRVDANGLDAATYTKLLDAMNYIYTTYGSVDNFVGPFGADNHSLADNTRVLTQAMVWIIANGVEEIGLDIGPWAFPDVAGFIAAFEDAIQAVLNNSPGATGPIASLVFLEGSMGEDYSIAQPQIIPIYGGNFENTSRKWTPSYGSVTATNAGNVPAILAGLDPKNGNAVYNDKKLGTTPFVVPNSNHFVFAQFTRDELVEGVALDFVVGNKYDIVGTGFVQLVDGNIVLTIDNFAKGSFGVTAFNQLPVTNNGNIHSQKEADLKKMGATTGFNHDNKTVVPCPVGNTIYLYIHCDPIQFYL